MSEEAIYLSDTEAPAFIFVDKEHQGKDGKGWRQSKDEGAYEPDAPLEVAPRPVEWTGTYVIERLVHAFKVDRYLPKVKNKRDITAHPQILHGRDDMADWPAADNQIVVGPSRWDIDLMEQAFGWLVHKGHPLLELSLFTKRKVYKARWATICRDHGWHVDTANDRARGQARRIADRLTLAKVPVL